MDHQRIRVLEIFFLVLVVALSYGFYLVMQPFVLNIFLAAVFTSLLFPTHDRLARRLGGRRTVASVALVVLVFVGVTVPATVIAILVYSEAISGYTAFVAEVPRLARELSEVDLLEWASGIPVLADYADELAPLELSEMLREAVRSISSFVLTATQRSFVSASSALANFLLVLLLMFFFFQSGHRLMITIYNVVPMPNRELREIASETRRTTAATLISTLFIGIIEGGYGAVLFLIFGLPSPFLWGFVIMIMSMIPLIGTNLVLVPAGVILITGGRVWAGILMILLGLGGVAATQNVIKPKLLGDRSGLHPALALLATIGGIAWLGLIGFLVGPLVATLFQVVWQQFGIRYRHELDHRDDEGSAATGTANTADTDDGGRTDGGEEPST
ncbi:MAG: AI-2E family transporter [Spirochaetota bacterium]